MFGNFRYLLFWIVCVSIPQFTRSAPAVVCTFHPLASVHHKLGQTAEFNLTCINKLWDPDGDPVVIVVDQNLGGSGGLSLCVESKKSCEIDKKEPVRLIMASQQQTYEFQVRGNGVGIRCLKHTTYYQRGASFYQPGMSPEAIDLLQNMTGLFQEVEVPDIYTEVIVFEPRNIEHPKVVEQHSKESKVRERMQTAEEVLFLDIQNSSIIIALENIEKLHSKLWREYTVYTEEEKSDSERKGNEFSKILTLIALASANLIIGTGIEKQVLQKLYHDFVSVWRQMSCLSCLVSLRAWKVGLFCQICYLPIISFALGKLFFRDGVQCSSVVDLSRLGLFLLGTAPGNTAATYFSALWNGDLQLSVALVILSTVLSPLSTLFWWETLGKILFNGSTSTVPHVPITFVLEFIAAMVLPVLLGIVLAGRFPTLKQFMKKVQKPLFVVGLIGCIVIYYFQYENFFDIFSMHHALACGSLSVGSAFMAGMTAYFCRLQRGEIISIVIDCCLQNGTLSYAVVKGSLQHPEDLYASSPANAQILFTSAPLMVTWIIYTGTNLVLDFVRQKKQCKFGKTNQFVLKVHDPEIREEIQMVCISNIKEAWTDEHNLKPLWC